MKISYSNNWLFLAVLVITASCSAKDSMDEGLKDALEGKFFMGTAMNTPQILGSDTAALNIIHKHFNSVVAENCMKSGPIQPKEGEFDFELSDRFIEFAEQSDLYTVGHCLVWHSQAPRWFFVDDQGNDVSKEVLT